MTVALTVSAYTQTMVERGMYGATWEGYFKAQENVWFLQGIGWRLVTGLMVVVGYGFLVYDLLTCDKKQPVEVGESKEAVAAA
jgi:nitric oxide reductase subunit B